MPAAAKPSTVPWVPMLCGGEWIDGPVDGEVEDVFNPSTGQVQARVRLADAATADRVVQAAREALPGWGETPPVERARVMFRLWQLMEQEFEELAALVTREHGKTLAESRAEVQRGLEMVEFAAGIPSLLMGECLPQIAPGVDAETNRHPVGVCVGITPYNFPNMVPMWMFPVAVVCGNTFVLKPSEKVPLSAVRLGELITAAGLPPGVFNILHGGRECVKALLEHDQVAAISFVGSTAVAKMIYEVGTRHGKRVQAAGGAKNHMIVMPDADLNQAVQGLAASAYGCAGQRCMAGSVAVAIGKAGDPLVDGLRKHSQTIKVGPSDGDDSVQMGPVIRREHRERVAGYLEIAAEEGGQVALDGRRDYGSDAFLIGPSIVDHVQPGNRLAREEVFGPLLSVIRVADLEQAIDIGQQCAYGNGASIFTHSGYAAREFKRHFNAGMIGINVGVPAPMAWFPFTGWNQSFFGDLHVQGSEGIRFYTRQKTTMTRWFESPEDSFHDPVWKSRQQG